MAPSSPAIDMQIDGQIEAARRGDAAAYRAFAAAL
jgi:hypothetical protein